MICYIHCIRRRSDISPADFRRYWDDPQFAALLSRMAQESQAIRCVRSLTLRIEFNAWLAESRGLGNPFDGVVELCWPDGSRLNSLRESPVLLGLAEELLRFEEPFVDRERSYAFFAESEDV